MSFSRLQLFTDCHAILNFDKKVERRISKEQTCSVVGGELKASLCGLVREIKTQKGCSQGFFTITFKSLIYDNCIRADLVAYHILSDR